MLFRRSGAARRTWTRSLRGLETLEERVALTATPPTVTNVSVGSTAWSSAFVSHLQAQGLGTQGFSIPVGSTAQTTTLPWNNLNQIRITFSEDVNVDISDLCLSGKINANYSFSDFDYTPETHEAVWTLASALPRDRYWIDLDAGGANPVTDLEGTALDGEWANNTSNYASGNGEAGGDFEFAFNVLVGDTNGSGQVLAGDWIAANNGKSTTSPGYNYRQDLNGSGVINSTDQAIVTANLNRTLPSGNPVGASNDAPMSNGRSYLAISDSSLNYAVSLWDAFADAESSDSQLVYSLLSNSNSSLFDSVSINSSTGQLILNSAANVSGRAELTISATDSQGLVTSFNTTVDVSRTNVIPTLTMTVTESSANVWTIEGWVTDSDDDLQDMFVQLTGLITQRVSVDATGYFVFVYRPSSTVSGFIWGSTIDLQGIESEEDWVEIGWN